jgi:FkbM family methyltransferase
MEQTAVSDHLGEAKLYLHEISSSYMLFDEFVTGRAEASIDVPTTTLSEIMRRHSLTRIDFLKMDCEGAEGLIFQSLAPDVLSRIDRIALEFHDNVSALNHRQLQSRMSEAGFNTAVNVTGGDYGYIYAWR